MERMKDGGACACPNLYSGFKRAPIILPLNLFFFEREREKPSKLTFSTATHDPTDHRTSTPTIYLYIFHLLHFLSSSLFIRTLRHRTSFISLESYFFLELVFLSAGWKRLTSPHPTQPYRYCAHARSSISLIYLSRSKEEKGRSFRGPGGLGGSSVI